MSEEKDAATVLAELDERIRSDQLSGEMPSPLIVRARDALRSALINPTHITAPEAGCNQVTVEQAAKVLVADLHSPPRDGDVQGWQRAFAVMNETPGEMWKRFAAALRALAKTDGQSDHHV